MNTLGRRPCFTGSLTAGIDNLTGDSGNNNFIGDAAFTSAADQINGGAGTDTFTLYGTGAVLPTLTSVERLVYASPTAAVESNVSAIAGLTDVVVQKAFATGTITTAAGTTVTYDGATTAALDQVVVTAATAAAATVGVTNGANLGELTVTGAAVKTLNIASNGLAANTIVSLAGSAGATAQANSTLNITGTQKLTIDTALDADFTTVNASTNTGGVSVEFLANDVTVTGGAGNDTFNFGTNLTVADKVDGGAGIDTVSVADLTATTLAGLNAVKNVETVELTGAAAVTVALGSAVGSLSNTAITKLVFNTDDAGIDVVNSADTAHTYAFGAANTGAATLNLATGVTTVNVALEGAGVVGALTVTPLASDLVATPALVSTVNIASSGLATAGANAIASVAAQAGSTINVTGSKALTIGALTNKATVDASAFTGNLVITGSAGADKIILGAGADTVNTGSTYATTDTITNFTKADTLVLTASTVGAAADLVKYDASNSLSLEAALVAADASAATGKAAYFVFGGDTYVVANIDAAASVTATGSTDQVVKLAGQVNLVADATGIHAAA